MLRHLSNKSKALNTILTFCEYGFLNIKLSVMVFIMYNMMSLKFLFCALMIIHCDKFSTFTYSPMENNI